MLLLLHLVAAAGETYCCCVGVQPRPEHGVRL